MGDNRHTGIKDEPRSNMLKWSWWIIEDVAGKFLWCINDKPRAAIQKVLYWKKLVKGEPIMLIFHFIVDDLVTPKGK